MVEAALIDQLILYPRLAVAGMERSKSCYQVMLPKGNSLSAPKTCVSARFGGY